MIEFLIVVSTMMSPACPTPPCYTKMEVHKYPEVGRSIINCRNGSTAGVEGFDIFVVYESTPIARCEVFNHVWVWAGDKMVCSVCGVERKIKRVEKKREVTDTEEVWEDDGSKVYRPTPNLWNGMMQKNGYEITTDTVMRYNQ